MADLPIVEHSKDGHHEIAIEEEESGETNGNGNTNGDGKGEEKKKKPPPTQFKEPDANSLLDSFGF